MCICIISATPARQTDNRHEGSVVNAGNCSCNTACNNKTMPQRQRDCVGHNVGEFEFVPWWWLAIHLLRTVVVDGGIWLVGCPLFIRQLKHLLHRVKPFSAPWAFVCEILYRLCQSASQSVIRLSTYTMFNLSSLLVKVTTEKRRRRLTITKGWSLIRPKLLPWKLLLLLLRSMTGWLRMVSYILTGASNTINSRHK